MSKCLELKLIATCYNYHNLIKLKINIYGYIQNITIFIQITNNMEGQGSPALCKF